MSDDADQEFLEIETLKRLCHELRGMIDKWIPEKEADTYTMEDLMLEYSKQRFAKKFNFEYDRNNSKPPHLKTGGKVEGYDNLFPAQGFPATETDVKNWMDYELFGEIGRNFPAWAIGDVTDSTRDHFLRSSGIEGNPYPNEWGTSGFEQIYNNPNPEKPGIQQVSHFLHIHVDLTLDVPSGGKGRVERTFVYFLGVFSSYV